MARYRIGEVSKFLDIPVETIRYYESKGIVNPEKDPDSKYRYYTAWDINFLTEYRKFRGFEFSQNEIQEILYEDNLETYKARFFQKQRYFEQQQLFYSCLVEKNRQYQEGLSRIDSDCFTPFLRPSFYYYFFRQNEDYMSDLGSLKLAKSWLNLFPLTDTFVIFNQSDVSKAVDDYAWGLALEEKYVEMFDVELNDKVIYEPAHQCMRTIVTAGEPGTLNGSLLVSPLKRLHEAGHVLNGSVFGNLLARVHENEAYRRHVELFIPFK